MNKSKLIILLAAILLTNSGCNTTITHTPGDELIIVMNEMKQEYGESFLIKYNDFEIVVDSGTSADTSTIRSTLEKYCLDNTIDLMIMTHPHGDHIGGFNSYAFNGYEVSKLVDFGYRYVSDGDDEISSPYIYNKYVEIRSSMINNGTIYSPITDEVNKTLTISKDDYLSLTWLKNDYYVAPNEVFPNSSIGSTNPNVTSICFNLTYKNWNFIFAGDADSVYTETSLMKNHPNLFKDDTKRVALKATHHASSSSLGSNFLRWSNAESIFCSSALIDDCAIPNEIKLGSGNGEQNHPNKTTVKRIKNHLANKNSSSFYWNGVNGTLKISCDGVNDLIYEGEGRTKNYYIKGTNTPANIENEKSVNFFESAFGEYF